LFRRGEFLPKQRTRRDLAGGVRFLQGFQLPFQLPQRKRHPHLRRDKKRLHKEHGPEKREHAYNEQRQPQSRPAFAGRIGKNKRRQRTRRDIVHEPPIFAHYLRNESREKLSSIAALYERRMLDRRSQTAATVLANSRAFSRNNSAARFMFSSWLMPDLAF